MLFGAGFTIGNVLGSWAADRNLMRTLQLALFASCAALLVLTASAHDKPLAAAALSLVGASAYATVPGFTARVIGMAGGGGGTLASAAAVAAFNLGKPPAPTSAASPSRSATARRARD